ncbi:MAG: DNA polymerase III subunit beta [Edaphocola sp.]
MRFIVSSTSLLKNLQLVGGIISSNVVLPILEDFLFELEGNNLTLTGGDMETMIKVQMEVQRDLADTGDATQNGRVCIPSKILLEYLKNLPEQPVHFVINKEDNSVELSSNTGRYKIGGEKADEYPKEPQPNDATSFNIPSVRLNEAVNKTLFATSTDTLRPAMTGVFFELGTEGINFVATDAHRLVKLSRTDIVCPEEGGFIVPRKPLQQLKNIIPADESPLQVSYNASHLFVQNDRIRLSCRLIEGKFPPYRAVIPADNPFTLTINRADLVSSLRRVSIFANKSTSQVVFDIVGNTVSISAQDIDFSYEGKEQMNCQYTGDDMKIAFNARLLIEMLNNMDGEDVSLSLSMPSRAGIYRPVDKTENEDLLMLLMPLMVNV